MAQQFNYPKSETELRALQRFGVCGRSVDRLCIFRVDPIEGYHQAGRVGLVFLVRKSTVKDF